MVVKSLLHLSVLIVALFACPLRCPGYEGRTAPFSAADVHNRVLVLFSYNNNLPSQQYLANGFEKARKEARIHSGDIHYEYLDFQDDPGRRKLVRELLLKKYEGCRFDLVVTVYDPALDFLLTDASELSKGSPCIAIFGMKREDLTKSGREVVQYPLEFDLKGTLGLARKLFPKTRHLVLALGSGKTDLVFEKRARSELPVLAPDLSVEYTSGRSVEEVLDDVSTLSSGTVVIVSRIEKDVTGRTFVPRDVTSMIARKSKVPVFCLVSAQLDTGVVGGSLVDFEAMGIQLAHEAVGMHLSHTESRASGKGLPAEPPSIPARPMFNWDQVIRWGLDPDLLPGSGIVINRPETFFSKYRKIALIWLLAIFVLIVFIAALLVVNRRRARAEKSAVESENRFRVLFEHAPDAIVVYDHNCDRIADANKSAEILFGCDKEQLIRKGLMAFYTDDQPDGKEKGASFREHFELASKVKPLIFERKIRSLDGRERICDVQLISLPSEKGGIMRASYTDITDRKRSEEALFLEKERYQSILKTAMDGFCLLDRDGRFLEVNDTYCMMCGYSSEELKNMTLYDVEAFEDKALLKQHVKTLLKQGKSRLETRHRHRNGHQVDVEVSVVYHPILGKGQFVAFIRDITERKVFESQRKNLEEQLHQAQKMEVLGTLAGGIAHDFNNILYPIIGFTEMLLENAPEEGDTRLSLEQILKASLRAADLVQQILAFSRQSEILRMPLRIQSVVRDSLKLMRASFPSTITIQSDIDKNCGMVMASPVHIHQIAMNLMTNAYHAMEENGGILSVTLSEIEITPEDPGKMELYPGRYVQYSVADTGHGIDRNILDRIFDPYFTTKAAGKGTGLGLSVVHGIVKSYGGGIRVKSEPGGGTVFDVLLPVMDPVEREGDVSKKTMDSKGGHEHILIVDDEDSILRMERRLLEQLGYRVTTRSDVVEALELFRSSSQRFDLVITDMTMPGMTGEKFAVELKQIRKDIPVILCTGFSSLISPEEAESLGVDCFLMKPVVKGDLIKTIRSLLDGS